MNTWLNIWVRPRQVMKQELEKAQAESSHANLFWLMILGSFFTVFAYMETDSIPTYTIVFISSLLGSFVAAALTWYLGAWVYKWVGSWIGGKGSVLDMRVAMVNGLSKTHTIISILCLPFIFIVGESYFLKGSAPEFDAVFNSYSTLQVFALSLSGLIMLTGGVWTWIISLHAIGEAHQFSAWKSLLMFVLVSLCTLGVVIVLALIIVIVMIPFSWV